MLKYTFKLLFMILLLLLISWSGTCFFVWLISLCFKFAFTLYIGTGVWLSLLLLNISLKIDVKK